MRQKTFALLASLLLGGSNSVAGQLPDWVNQILAAAQLPVVANQVRQDGVPQADILAILDAMRNASVPAYDARVILDSARAARRDNGPVDNFGAFVQSQLASGKRGTELAAAIRAEHARQGKGRPGGASNARGASTGAAARGARGRGADPKAPGDTGRGRNSGGRGRGRPPTL